MADEVELTSEARIQKARALYDKATINDRTVDPRTRREAWSDLWQCMKTWKRNWAALGFSPREIERIKDHKPEWL